MENEVIRITRQVCCRLCLAPDSECVSIYGVVAADREPLAQKIQSCVSIKVHDSDRLSSRVCHGCISFLNSWQSFKNRCVAAQKKQKQWLAAQLQRQLGLDDVGTTAAGGEDDDAGAIGSVKQSRSSSVLSLNSDANGADAYNYYQSILHRKGTLANAGPQQQTKSLLNRAVKEEPKDDDDTAPVTVNMELDPRHFLAGADDDDDDDDDDGMDDDREEGEYVDGEDQAAVRSVSDPLILNALGLTNVSHVNPLNFLATDLDDPDGGGGDDAAGTTIDGLDDDLDSGTLRNNNSSMSANLAGAQCRVCKMGFSNRANARRHERNIHGIQTTPDVSANNVAGGGGGAAAPIAGQNPASLIKRPLVPGSTPARARPPAPALEEFDYTQPDRYRHLLTETRLSFIRRNARFLSQYQDLTCKCCDRKYFTYKTFMSHMRKKYTTLPRNVCFKCLRKFESKGMFIAHLKKKHCLNLFTLFMADASIPKDAKLFNAVGGGGGLGGGLAGGPGGPGGERMGPKEMLANKVYACKICNEQFRLKNGFRAHVVNDHPADQNQRDPATGNCRRCLATFADSTERKRHFSNMDCLVAIVCGTCEQEFVSHASFIDHVYMTHMRQFKSEAAARDREQCLAAAQQQLLQIKPEPPVTGDRPQTGQQMLHPQLNSMRSPQSCPVCDKQYNNYYNVLRHMEAKHPEQLPKTYTCEICAAGFPRQTELRDHVKSDHSDLEKGAAETNDVAADAMNVTTATSTARPAFTCVKCKQSFGTEQALKYHSMVQHMEQESYETQFKRMANAAQFKEKKQANHVNNNNNNSSNNKNSNNHQGDNYDDDRSEGEAEADDDLLTLDTSAFKTEDLQRVRECPICVEKYSDLVEFIGHMKQHVKNEGVSNLDLEPGVKAGAYHSRMRCRMCQKRISSKVGYRKHLLDEHQIEDCEFVRCDLCPGEFSNEKGLKVHMFRTHNICIKEDGELTSDQLTAAGMGAAASGNKAVSSAAGAVKEPQFECQICHTVYRNEVQLRSHVSTVHNIDSFEEYLQQHCDGGSAGGGGGGLDDDPMMMDDMNMGMDFGGGSGMGSDYTPIEVWFQCRYCDDNFASRQKLTVHMNTHDEHDPNDYTCKECGNVYLSRKSLWVHRNKKHPRPQIPSPCDICKKVFFDKMELVLHLKTHVIANIDYILMDAQNGSADEDADGSGAEDGTFDCHVCNKKFRDGDKLAKHIRVHEMQNNMFTLGAFTEAGMDDSSGGSMMNGNSGGGVFEPQMADDGSEEYACDMCPKRFPLLTALKVHRGWHYRSPDGRQITEAGQTWQPGSVPPSRMSKTAKQLQQQQQQQQTSIQSKKPATSLNNSNSSNNNVAAVVPTGAVPTIPGARQPKCQFCYSTFASSNNLRRHIVEVHKRNDWRAQRDAQSDGGVFIEKEKECQSCGKQFESRAEWIDHKIAHARVMRPSTTFEWACEICGKSFTRKERLLQHMHTHLSSGGSGTGGGGSGSQSASNSRAANSNSNSRTSNPDDEDDDDEDNFEDDDDEVAAAGAKPKVLLSSSGGGQDHDDENANDAYDGADSPVPERQLSCYLCQVDFENEDELRRHVKAHFINGVGTIGNEKSVSERVEVKAAAPPAQKRPKEKEAEEGERPAKKPKTEAENDLEDEEENDYVEEENEGDEEEEDVDPSLDDDELVDEDEGEVLDPDLEMDEDEEGEYVEEYVDEDKIKSPAKTTSGPQQQQHKCRLCNTPFENSLKALKCMESHRQLTKYPCDECDLFFVNQKQLNGHQHVIHGLVN